MMSRILQAETQTYLTLLSLSQHYSVLNDWLTQLPSWFTHIKDKSRYAHSSAYASVVERLPEIHPHHQRQVTLNQNIIDVALNWHIDEYKKTHSLLQKLMPWRKGPFRFGADNKQIFIDTEWRSDWKWQRLQPHLGDLTHKRVLDVGGGSGYHGWRMVGNGASTVIVIDPSCLFYHQFMAVRHLIGDDLCNVFGNYPIHFLPIALEQLPNESQLFHTVFSMGVLYHRLSPFEHLEQLKGQLKKGGELVLETLVITGDEQQVLVPQGRYAQMNNVYFIPSIHALISWLQKVGFVDVRCVDVAITSTDEQRRTEWMTYHSLANFLNPNNPKQTIEGYPAPMRAIILAKKG